MKIKGYIFFILIVSMLYCLAGCKNVKEEQEPAASWPKRVLITNDDGIDSPGIKALAQAFSHIAETYVIAPDKDRSGTSHFLQYKEKDALTVETRFFGEGIQAYAVDAYPADCVLLALTGIMRENPPDLVISGINSGPNLGKTWLASGTIGAARYASFAGIPAIALSGMSSKKPETLEAAAKWSIRLVQSSIVRELRAPQFLTVSFPRTSPGKIKGIRVAVRDGLRDMPSFTKQTSENGREIWTLDGRLLRDVTVSAYSDQRLYESGYIVVVPMRADEHDYALFSRLQRNHDMFPKWP